MDGADRAGAEERRLREVYGSYAAAHYDAKWSDHIPGNIQMAREVEDKLRSAFRLTAVPIAGKPRILDLGCGEGASLRLLRSLRPQTALAVGCDVLLGAIRVATELVPEARFAGASGLLLPFRSSTFDVITMFTVLSSVADQGVSRRLAAEARRVLRPGGIIVVYDLRYPSLTNRFVRRVSHRRLRALFPEAQIRVRSLTLLPPLARAIGKHPVVYTKLASIPLLRSHFLAIVTED